MPDDLFATAAPAPEGPPRPGTAADAMALLLGWADELSFPRRAPDEARARGYARTQGRADAPRFLTAARRLPAPARAALAAELLRD